MLLLAALKQLKKDGQDSTCMLENIYAFEVWISRSRRQ
jgi:hypothetical protein